MFMLNSRPRRHSGFISFLFGPEKNEPIKQRKIKPETMVRLQELCVKHTFVNVKFTDRTDCSFQSLILKVDVKKQSLLIDELFPMQPDVSIIPGERIEITTSGKGLPVKFKSAIGAIEILDGSPAYRIVLPRKVKANQRREFFRVAINRDMKTELRIVVGGGSMILCNLTNISSSGIGFSIDKNITEKIQSNRILKAVKLSLPDNSILQCDLEVRCYEYRRPPHRCTAIGARFVNLSPASQRVLDKLVTQLQRETRDA